MEAATCDRFGNPVLSLGPKSAHRRALAAQEDFQNKPLPAFSRFRDVGIPTDREGLTAAPIRDASSEEDLGEEYSHYTRALQPRTSLFWLASSSSSKASTLSLPLSLAPLYWHWDCHLAFTIGNYAEAVLNCVGHASRNGMGKLSHAIDDPRQAESSFTSADQGAASHSVKNVSTMLSPIS